MLLPPRSVKSLVLQAKPERRFSPISMTSKYSGIRNPFTQSSDRPSDAKNFSAPRFKAYAIPNAGMQGII